MLTESRIILGDCREVLGSLESESVQCCVTSPPYYGLRDYGVDGQVGLEQTPEEYIATMVAVFQEVRRVLCNDGTLWLNLGDSYAANRSHQVTPTKWKSLDFGQSNTARVPDGLKPKDLIGIPWRVALALQSDGWYLRSDIIEEVELYCPCGCGYVMEERIWRYSQDREIIWKKPNPMPESVKDRPTKSHEYLFLLTKSQRYYYDTEAVSETLADSSVSRLKQNIKDQNGSNRVPGKTNGTMKATGSLLRGKRNRRSVWSVTTQPTRFAHFATFPEALVEPCIKAGSRIGDTILDPFAGAGAVGVVAEKLERSFVGIELNPEYREMAIGRINKEKNSRPLLRSCGSVGTA